MINPETFWQQKQLSILAGCTIKYGLLNWPIPARIAAERNNKNRYFLLKVALVVSHYIFPSLKHCLYDKSKSILHKG